MLWNTYLNCEMKFATIDDISLVSYNTSQAIQRAIHCFLEHSSFSSSLLKVEEPTNSPYKPETLPHKTSMALAAGNPAYLQHSVWL